MAKTEIKRPYPGKDTDKCYQACQRVAEKAGYKIFKKREIASLVICEGTLDGQRVDLSLMVPFGFPTAIVITLASEAASQETLDAEVNRLFTLMDVELR